MASGAYTLNNGATMVVSRGLARESTPLPRFFNHPEVVIVNLRRMGPNALQISRLVNFTVAPELKT